MSLPKLHPSIVLHKTSDSITYTVGSREVSGDDVVQVSDELWEITLTAPERPHRTPRGEDMLWG